MQNISVTPAIVDHIPKVKFTGLEFNSHPITIIGTDYKINLSLYDVHLILNALQEGGVEVEALAEKYEVAPGDPPVLIDAEDEWLLRGYGEDENEEDDLVRD